MKLKNLPLFILAFISIALASCKLDPPIYPNDPDFVPYTPGAQGGSTNGGGTGGGGTGGGATGTVDESLIGGKWMVSKMYNESYINGSLQLSMEAFINLYTGVELVATDNSYQFEGSFDAPFPGTYALSKQGSTVYIQLEADPFNRSANDKIKITNLTSTSMTWLAMEPIITDTPVGKVQAGWKVVYTRVP